MCFPVAKTAANCHSKNMTVGHSAWTRRQSTSLKQQIRPRGPTTSTSLAASFGKRTAYRRAAPTWRLHRSDPAAPLRTSEHARETASTAIMPFGTGGRYRVANPWLSGRSASPARRTSSANDSASIFRMTCPRCAFTVISLIPSS